jgi:hypothetical protein
MKIIAKITSVKESKGRVIMYLEHVSVDSLGLTQGNKIYRRGYIASMKEQAEALIGSEVYFDSEKVEVKEFTLPADHAHAGEIAKLSWIQGDMQLVDNPVNCPF